MGYGADLAMKGTFELRVETWGPMCRGGFECELRHPQ